MNQDPRLLVDLGVQFVNTAASNARRVADHAAGTPRGLAPADAIALINAQALLAIACALLAIATKE